MSSLFWKRFYDMCILNNTKPNPVAEKTGISSGIVTKWKTQDTLPNGENLIKIANHLDCSTDYLLGRTDNPLSHKISLEGKPSVSPSKEMQIRKNVSLADSGEIAAEGGELNSGPKKRKKETTL